MIIERKLVAVLGPFIFDLSHASPSIIGRGKPPKVSERVGHHAAQVFETGLLKT